MRYFTNILRWISSQEHLYFLFGLLFIIPNCVFLFTEPLPVSVGLASIIMPLAFWMGILLLARKPGVVVWCLLPKIILDGGQLVLLYLFGESVIAVDMFLNLTSSNASEASELLGNIFLVIICVFLFYTLPTLWLAMRSVRMEDKLSAVFRKKWAFRSLGLFVVGVLLCFLPSLQKHSFSLKNDGYPVNALYNLYFAITKSNKNANYSISSADFRFNSVRTGQADGKREIYVLVVGETSRAMEWSLYGYERNTTPRMEGLDGLVHFTDVVTQSNNTHKSVPIILSAASAENYGVIYDEKSIVTAFKEAGFHTAFFSNQLPNHSFIDFLGMEADDWKFIKKDAPKGANISDDELLFLVEKELKAGHQKLFIVLHAYGSHFNYKERYPESMSVFKPDNLTDAKYENKEYLMNAYDNTIRYTDGFLASLITLLQKTNSFSAMLYTSDHGEDIFDDNRKLFLHASPVPSYYQLHVPFLIWLSKTYREKNVEVHEAILQNREKPVAGNASVFHTMLNLAGVQTPYRADSLSVANRQYLIRPRYYLNDHNLPKSLDKIGLKKEDIEQFRRNNLVFP